MRVPCLCRAGHNGAVIRSLYEITTGYIDEVPESLFKCVLPYNVSVMFRNQRNDITFSDVTLRLAANHIYRTNNWRFVFADYGNHIYLVSEKGVLIESLRKDEQAHVPHEEAPNMFDVETYPIGFFRQSAITFDVNPSGIQKLNLFKTQSGVFYFNGEEFKAPDFMCDIKPDYSVINLIGFLRNPDESVIGVASYKGKEVFIRK